MMAAASRDRAVRYLVKPLVFVACLLPVTRLILAALGVWGLSLGANPVEALLHGMGKWALNFLILTLAISPLRSIAGWPRLIRLRRMLGLFAFFYALAHFLVYLVLDQSLAMQFIVEDILERPYITLGFTALVLLLPLAATSTRGMMRRLGSRWQRLHRLIYPASILVVWHYWWQVKEDIREPLIYATVLGALLGWRLLRHRRKGQRQPTAVPGKSGF